MRQLKKKNITAENSSICRCPKDTRRHFAIEDMPTANRHMKGHPTLSLSVKCKLKPQWVNTAYGNGCNEKEGQHYMLTGLRGTWIILALPVGREDGVATLENGSAELCETVIQQWLHVGRSFHERYSAGQRHRLLIRSTTGTCRKLLWKSGKSPSPKVI